MQRAPRPILTPIRRRRPSRRQIARRRGFAALVVVLAVVAVWYVWPFGGSPEVRATGANPPRPAGSVSPQSPIKHVVFLVKENRTFNEFFGRYPGVAGSTTAGTLVCHTGHPCTRGPTIPLKKAPDVQPHDITHGFVAGLQSIDGGKMDGYNTILYGTDESGYNIFSRNQIPNYWAYADRFVLADHFFTSMYGPTFPEHLYTIAAQSRGIVDNKQTSSTSGNYCTDPSEIVPAFRQDLTPRQKKQIMVTEDNFNKSFGLQIFKISQYWEHISTCINVRTLPDELQKAGVSWGYYAGVDQWMNAMQAIRHDWFSPTMRSHIKDPSRFLPDLHRGRLPAVSWLDPPEPYNDHPGSGVSVCSGENWTVNVINNIMKSKYWPSTAIIVVWDDFGGFYDPVPPPHYDIMGLGPRTPALIISPYTTQGSNPDGGSVDHTVYEFSSVLRFIELLHGLKPLTSRDAQADPLTGAFDFTAKPDLKRLILPLRPNCPYGDSVGSLQLGTMRTLGVGSRFG